MIMDDNYETLVSIASIKVLPGLVPDNTVTRVVPNFSLSIRCVSIQSSSGDRLKCDYYMQPIRRDQPEGNKEKLKSYC